MSTPPRFSVRLPHEMEPMIAAARACLQEVGLNDNSDVSEKMARAVLTAFISSTLLPFDKTRKWHPGERAMIRGFNGSYPDKTRDRYCLIVGVERYAVVGDMIRVVFDGEDIVKGVGEDVLAHVRGQVDPEEIKDRGLDVRPTQVAEDSEPLR